MVPSQHTALFEKPSLQGFSEQVEKKVGNSVYFRLWLTKTEGMIGTMLPVTFLKTWGLWATQKHFFNIPCIPVVELAKAGADPVSSQVAGWLREGMDTGGKQRTSRWQQVD